MSHFYNTKLSIIGRQVPIAHHDRAVSQHAPKGKSSSSNTYKSGSGQFFPQHISKNLFESAGDHVFEPDFAIISRLNLHFPIIAVA